MTGEYSFSNLSLANVSIDRGSVETGEGMTIVYPETGTRSLITLKTKEGKQVRICTLIWEEALRFWKISLWGRERIILTEANLLTGAENITLCGIGNPGMSLEIYPPVTGRVEAADWQQSELVDTGMNGIFSGYRVQTRPKSIVMDVQLFDNKAVVNLNEDSFDGVADIYLRIDYTGDIGNAFIDGKLINDNFYNGTTWEIGLKRFNPQVVDKGLYIHINPLRRGEYVTLDTSMALKQEFVGDMAGTVHKIEAIPEYRVMLVQKI